MGLCTTLCIVILGTCFSSFLLPYEYKKLDGYEFPVYSTELCPRNQEEWNLRSSAINCTNTNAYMCIPNDNFTELLEFCYIYPRMLIQKDLCLYLVKRYSRVNAYNCSNFRYGCPENNYLSSNIFQHQSCIHVENGCFFAEPSCKSKTTTNTPKTTNFKQTANIKENTTVSFNQETTEQIQNEKENKDELILVPTLTRVGLLILMISFCLLFIYFRKNFLGSILRRLGRNRDEHLALLDTEKCEAIETYKGSTTGRLGRNKGGHRSFFNIEECETMATTKESLMEKAIFHQWEQDNDCFISTRACKEVEKLIKRRNLVIVAGHSGSGKSAIIQHIALKYREQGWTIKRVKKVKDIVDEYYSSGFKKDKTICVFNDPLGKHYFDEILNNSLQTYEEEIKLYLKTAKLVMSCRYHIISDTRVTRYFVNLSDILNIDANENKLSVNEKREILNKYTSDMNLSVTDPHKIVEVERYFPLLCKLYSSKEEHKHKSIEFFQEPERVLKEEILGFRIKDKEKYCALALLVLFNGDLCVSDFFKNENMANKFKRTLYLCGLPENTPPFYIGYILYSMTDFYVKNVMETYTFYHDFVMEVTTHVFGTEHPREIVEYADIGFIKNRVKLENSDKHEDSFTIYISHEHIKNLGERLFTELFGERLLDVVLNPCLRNVKVIKLLIQKIENNPKNHQMLFETRKVTIDKQELPRKSKNLLLTKLSFLNLESKISPLFALIAFCHTQLSKYCLNNLQKLQTNIIECIPALYCNGSIELFSAFKDHAEESLKKTWGKLYPIHIVSVFHNYELFVELIKIGVNVNQKTDDYGGWTPLMLAAGNDTQEYGDINHGESDAKRRDKTVELLLSNGADINLCKKDGSSPLYIACENGYDSTVQLLLSNGADIKLCKEDGSSPLYMACENGYDSTVQLLLSNGANINLCKKDGSSPLYIACENGYDSTVQLLLRNGADIELCKEDGSSPLSMARENGYESTVQLLLSNGANINLC